MRTQLAAQAHVPLPLGQGAVVPDSVTSLDGLAAGTDFTVDASVGTVTLAGGPAPPIVTFDFEPVTPPPPLPPIPDPPVYGADLPAPVDITDLVTQGRAYLALTSPTQTQTAAAVKGLVRLALFMLRRLI